MRAFLNALERFYPLAVALFFVAVSFWLERQTRGEEAVEKPASTLPDFTADTVRLTGFGEDGALRYTLDSPHMTHLPKTDTTLLEQPRLFFTRNGQRMNARADRGEAGPKGEQIELDGNVQVEREPAPGLLAMHLFSESLTVWPQEQRAVSNAPVRIDQGTDTATADRLEASHVFGVMALSGKVHMRLLPRQQRNP